MALIPMIFKNNDTVETKTKIGRVTSTMQRMINSFLFSGKVGILKGYANECSIASSIGGASTTTITFNQGALSIYGGVILIEQGTILEVPNVANGSIGIYVDLSRGAGNEATFYAGANAPTDADNLQDNEVAGKYYFELYKYSVTGTTFTQTQKTDKFINENEDYGSGEKAVAKANQIVPSSVGLNSVSFYVGDNVIRMEW